MIHCLNGTVVSKSPDEIVISCSGVGFRVLVPSGVYSAAGNAGDSVFLYTHLAVREDAFELYGFSGEDELNCFKMLIGVSGIGPRSGLSILSMYTPGDVALAIASGDHRIFAACSGIGMKLAQRIVLELKDRIGPVDSFKTSGVTSGSEMTGNRSEALSAVTSLGFSPREAAAALANMPGGLSTEELVSGALRSLARK